MRPYVVLAIATAACGRIDFDISLLTYRDAVLADAPVGYWRLGDLGATARDETGHVDGTYVGNCSHGVAGALTNDPDTAVQLDGASCYVSLADAFGFASTAPFSVEIWVATTKTTTQHFVTRQTRSGPNPLDGYALLLGPQNTAYLERTVAGADSTSTKTPLGTGPFSYVVGTYDGAALRMYIDGVASSAEVADPLGLNAFSFVALIGVASATGTSYTLGILDEVALYDHALEPARIALHYDIGVNGPR